MRFKLSMSGLLNLLIVALSLEFLSRTWRPLFIGTAVIIGISIILRIILNKRFLDWIDSCCPYEEPEEEEPEDEIEEESDEDELPFCQIFRLDRSTDLHIIKVEYCPDETAFIRIVTDESFTQPYKRKVMRDKRGERYINFNNEKYYLDPKKTQARMPE